jgi:glycosyltransferase involved in cell wall biosynthesis
MKSAKINELNALPEVLYITSYPPRECGIATYSQDLIQALKLQFEGAFEHSICALETETERFEYAERPKYILRADSRNSYIKTAYQIKRDEAIKVVVIQHEFGFFSKNINDFHKFYHHLQKPLVFVFHTVLPIPNEALKKQVADMAEISSLTVVMTENAKHILQRDYDVASYKIRVISHGTHLVPPKEKLKLKEQFGLSKKKVLSTFGLLGHSKSIETTLRALPQIVAAHDNVEFLILGKTHPNLLKSEGEVYRKFLEHEIKRLNLGSHVTFVNEYLPLPILLEYLQLSDIYLFTSKDPNQSVSGTFSYAASCGCPVISTPIPHAKEILKNENGIIIPFEDSEELALRVMGLLDDEYLRECLSLRSLHKMSSTAWQNSAILHALLFKEVSSEIGELHYRLPEIKLDHIYRMTTEFGFVQFAQLSIPDLDSGYTLDDNSRALIALCQHFELTLDIRDVYLIKTYLDFIEYSFDSNESMLNYFDKTKTATEQNLIDNLEDSTGRAVWALGYLCSLQEVLPRNLVSRAMQLMEVIRPMLGGFHSTRAMAFIIKGLYYEHRTANKKLITVFADRLVQMYLHEKDNDWRWFEDRLTYGNGVLPEALLMAYKVVGKNEYKHIAVDTFDFLRSKIFVEGRIRVVSNKNWRKKGDISLFHHAGEQPIDVCYTILALELFYETFKQEEYRQNARLAFNWFLGANHLNQIVYNPCTGGCYDGVEQENVNLNQGAESTICYLMARLSIERLGK